jgi:phosphoglycolate phosphatase
LLIIFDLDGTLIDSSKDLEISVNATRKHFGLAPLDPLLIHCYVGNGAPVLIRRAFGPDASEQLVGEALSFFLKFYRAHALEHTRLFPGVAELIRELSEARYKLGVLTNKPVKISMDILAALKVQEYFFRILGGDSLPVKKPDPTGIFELMKQAGESADDTLMVGDSAVDVQTARNAGVKCCGVTWGIQPESFVNFPPDFLISDPNELLAQVAA